MHADKREIYRIEGKREREREKERTRRQEAQRWRRKCTRLCGREGRGEHLCAIKEVIRKESERREKREMGERRERREVL